MAWSTVWNLPAPVGKVLVTEATVRHIFNEHMTGDEPWDSVLPAPLLERLRNCWSASPAERGAVLDEVAALVAQAIQWGAARPLFVSYEQRDEGRAFLHSTSEVIAPDGFVAVIRRSGTLTELKTAFFPDAVRSERPSRRWLAAVKSRVELYAVRWLVGGREVFGLPGPTDDIGSVDPPGTRVNIAFDNPKVWGFREVLFPDQASPLMVWGGHPLPWPEKPAVGGPAPTVPKLKKPRGGPKTS
jgi:hypothetical protein